jgi:hypothetical protein
VLRCEHRKGQRNSATTPAAEGWERGALRSYVVAPRCLVLEPLLLYIPVVRPSLLLWSACDAHYYCCCCG